MLRKLFYLICLLLASPSIWAVDKVVLQLKWEHQFQFAGYYAADWQGFYKEVGLEVEIRSGVRPDKTIVRPNDELKNGRAQFAVSSIDILLGRAQGFSPVVLAPIFQRSPVALFSLKSTDISSLDKVSKLRIAAMASEATKIEIESLFISQGYSISDIDFVDHPLTVDTLISGKSDVIATYRTPAQFEAKENNVELNELNPSDFGMSFYGDTLYSSADYVEKNSDIVRRFVEATKKGWLYALENKLSIARRIADELPRYMIKFDDAYAFNLAFSNDIVSYIRYPEIPIGHINKARWFNMNERIRSMGLVRTPLEIESFFLPYKSEKPDKLSNKSVVIFISLALLVSLIFLFWFKRSRNLTLISILVTSYVLQSQIESTLIRDQLNREKTMVAQKLNTITAQLQGNLQTNLSMLTGFAAYISATPNLSYQDFARYAKQLFRKNPLLINFAAARDLTVNYVYPKEGNEKAIGLNYRENPNQIDMVMQVVQTGQMMVIGPVNLVQGGKAFIGRAPIFTNDGKLWGIISAPLNSDLLFKFADLEKLSNGIELAIRNFDALGAEGPVFYGNSDVIDDPDRISSVISVGGGSWHLDARYYTADDAVDTSIYALRGYFLFATLFICVFVWFRFKQREETLLLQQEIKDDKILLESVGRVAKIGGWKLDPNLNFISWSSHCSILMGQDADFSPSQLTELESCFSSEDFSHIASKTKEALNIGESFDIEISLIGKKEKPVWLRIMSDAKQHGKDSSITGTLQDVTNKVLSAKLIEHQATYDSLTGLPNRLLYNDRLTKALELAKRKNQKIAVLFIDLDRFKPINDNHGHHAGDIILIETANRIKQTIRKSDTVSRLSGDEFAVILFDIIDYQDVSKLAEQIIEKIQQPYHLEEFSVHSSASIGIALYPDDADNADSLLRKADQAMYEVKASGRNGSQFYTKEMQLRSEYRHQLLNDLIVAVNEDKLEAYFQPIFDLKSDKLTRCESLARWLTDDGRFVSPDDFITLAEESGLINRIDLYMLQQSTAYLKTLSYDIGLSINISPRLFHTKDKALDNWLNYIKNVSQEIQITVEITERLLTDDSERVLVVLEELQNYGVKIAIDDFGTGYSSLSYLIKYPVDIIKIDKSFIHNIGTDFSAETLIESILAMAGRLGIEVVAEGIETEQQLNYLKKFGCDYGQGYFLAHPMNQDSFTSFIESGND